MATEILQHPISFSASASCEPDTYSFEELTTLLEHQDPFVMPLKQLEGIISGTTATGSGAYLRAYLVGIYDTRRMLEFVRPDLITH